MSYNSNSSSVSIIIRSCNEERHIGRLLNGVFQQTIQTVEVIVVDSGSTDQTIEIVSRYPVRVVNLHPDEFSFGRALNLGCQSATGEFIIISSAHVYPIYSSWLESLLTPFTDSRVAMVYGKQRGAAMTKYSEHQIFAHWFPEQSTNNQMHPFCNNANAAIRRSVWERLPYDETLTGLEDLDWAKRAMQAGHRIAYSAEAEIVHVHDEKLGQVYNRYKREAIALKRIFENESFKGWDFIRLVTMNVLSDYYHALLDHVFFRNIFAIPRFRLMQFWGTYRGFLHTGCISKKLRETFYYPRGLRRPTPHNELERGKLIVYGSCEPTEKSISRAH